MGSVGDRISNIRDGRTKSKPLLEKNARGSQSRTNPILDVGEQDEDITRGGTMDGMCWLSGWMRRTTWGGGGLPSLQACEQRVEGYVSL